MKYNYDGLLQQHRSHRMIISGVDAIRNNNVSSYVGNKIFRMVRAATKEEQGN